MNHIPKWAAAIAPALLLGAVAGADAPPVARPIPFEEAKERTLAWAAAAAKTDRPPEAVARVWETADPAVPPRALLELAVRSFAAADPAAAEALAAFDPRTPPAAPPDVEPLLARSADGFYRTNLALHWARLLTDARMYDEALTLYEQADLSAAIDPASALFYKAVCEHQLLLKDEGLKTLAALDSSDPVPDGYAAVARLMRAELEALEPDSLGEVAGLMRDVERRLDLARGGQRVQKKEDEITAKLDEMIKKIEQQMSRSSGGGGSSGGANRASNPLGDSVVKGSTAPGEVDPKTVGKGGGWGDLPPREREQAKNEIEKAFPSNYGRLINEYFLKRTRVDRPDGGEAP